MLFTVRNREDSGDLPSHFDYSNILIKFPKADVKF